MNTNLFQMTLIKIKSEYDDQLIAEGYPVKIKMSKNNDGFITYNARMDFYDLSNSLLYLIRKKAQYYTLFLNTATVPTELNISWKPTSAHATKSIDIFLTPSPYFIRQYSELTIEQIRIIIPKINKLFGEVEEKNYGNRNFSGFEDWLYREVMHSSNSPESFPVSVYIERGKVSVSIPMKQFIENVERLFVDLLDFYGEEKVDRRLVKQYKTSMQIANKWIAKNG